MKKYFLFGGIMLTNLVLVSRDFMSKKASAPISVTGSKSFAVVELFTSEGCSSCPAADAVVANLLSKKLKDVYILSYHVDYWNRLGWKDEFSSEKYSARQQQYARYLSLDGVYTPQVIVNGTVQFVGSNEGRLNSAVNDGLHNAGTSNLAFTAEKKNNNIEISYNITGDEAVFLNTAIVTPEATTNVKRGENGGRTLHHVNIVSGFKVTDAKGDGNLTIEIPGNLLNKPVKIILYTQDKKSFKILGAAEVDI